MRYQREKWLHESILNFPGVEQYILSRAPPTQPVWYPGLISIDRFYHDLPSMKYLLNRTLHPN